eukprot:761363-Hanusia_phi.AAC.2
MEAGGNRVSVDKNTGARRLEGGGGERRRKRRETWEDRGLPWSEGGKEREGGRTLGMGADMSVCGEMGRGDGEANEVLTKKYDPAGPLPRPLQTVKPGPRGPGGGPGRGRISSDDGPIRGKPYRRRTTDLTVTDKHADGHGTGVLNACRVTRGALSIHSHGGKPGCQLTAAAGKEEGNARWSERETGEEGQKGGKLWDESECREENSPAALRILLPVFPTKRRIRIACMRKKSLEKNSKTTEESKIEAPKTRSAISSSERVQSDEHAKKKDSKPSKAKISIHSQTPAKKNLTDEERQARRESLRKTRNNASNTNETKADFGFNDEINNQDLTKVETEGLYLSPKDDDSEKDFEFLIEDDQKETPSCSKYPPWPYFINCRVEALYDDGIWYQGILKEGSKGNANAGAQLFQVVFDDGEEIWTELPADDIRIVETLPKKGLKVFIYLDETKSSKKSAMLHQNHDNFHVKYGGKTCSVESFCSVDDESESQQHPYDAIWVAQSPEVTLLEYCQQAFSPDSKVVQQEESTPVQNKPIPGQEAPLAKRGLLPKDWKVLVKDDNSHYYYIAPDGTTFSNMRRALNYASKLEGEEGSSLESMTKGSVSKPVEGASAQQSSIAKETKLGQGQSKTMSENEERMKNEDVKKKGKERFLESKDMERMSQEDAATETEVFTRSLRKRTRESVPDPTSSKKVSEIEEADRSEPVQLKSSGEAIRSEATIQPTEDRPVSDAYPQTKVILFEEDMDIEEVETLPDADEKQQSEIPSDHESDDGFEGFIEERDIEGDTDEQGQDESLIEEVEVDELSESFTSAVGHEAALEETQSRSAGAEVVALQSKSNRRQFNVGDFVSVQDCTKKWCTCEILKVLDGKVKVHYINWSSDWDEWIELDSDRLQESDVIVDNGKRKSSKSAKETVVPKKHNPKSIKLNSEKTPSLEEKQSWVCSVDMKKGFTNGSRYIGEQVRIRDRMHGLLRGLIDDFDERGYHVALEDNMKDRWIRLPDADVDFLQIVAQRPEPNQYPKRTTRPSFVCTGCEKQFQTKQGLHFHLSRSDECQNVFYNLNIPLPPGIAWKIAPKKSSSKSKGSASVPTTLQASEVQKSLKLKKRKGDMAVPDNEKRQKASSTNESSTSFISNSAKDLPSSRASKGRSIASLVIAEVLRRTTAGEA